MKNYITLGLVLVGLILFSNSNAAAHDVFQDVLKEKYTLKSFSCKTCHPDSDNRKIRTKFADRIHKELKGKNLSEKFAVAEKAGEEAVKEFEKEVAKDFGKAWETVSKQQMTFDDFLKAGLFNGARLDTKKLAAKAAEAGGDAANKDEGK
jgi:hypothetical protein